MNSFEVSRSTDRHTRQDFQMAPFPGQENLSELLDQFHNFDEPDVYDDCMNRAMEKNTTNFVVRVELHDAHIATNLREQDMAALLTLRSNVGFDTTAVTWIHFWTVEACHSVIRTISKHYNFSEQLERSIFDRDDFSKESSRETRPVREGEIHENKGQFPRRPISTRGSPFLGKEASTRGGCSDPASSSKVKNEIILNQDDDMMIKFLQPRNKHTTIDHDFNYICVGAYWLHEGPSASHSKGALHRMSSSLVLPEYTNHPKLSKNWAWYILTDDYTVISIQKAPIHDQTSEKSTRDRMKDLSKLQDLRNMRLHIKATVAQLSRVGATRQSSHYPSPLDIRGIERDSETSIGKKNKNPAQDHWAAGVSASIFHCLIDNYSAGSSILNESSQIRDSISSRLLGAKDTSMRLRGHYDLFAMKQMQQRVLEELKTLVVAHERLVKVILNLEFDIIGRKEYPVMLQSRWSSKVHSPSSGPMPHGVKLPQDIYYRFVRLYNRIRGPLFVENEWLSNRAHGSLLDEIDWLLEDFRALSLALFDLAARHDSRIGYRTVQIASMLSNLGIIFFPLFMVNAIFSVKIPSIADHEKAYSITLGVAGALSVLALLITRGIIGRA